MNVRIFALLAFCGLVGGACSGDTTTAKPSAIRCSPAQFLCDGACTDIYRDRDHCGGCGQACRPSQICQGGGCRTPPLDCRQGETACDYCTDVRVDSNNCGQCGNGCDPPTTCINGRCVITCLNSTFCPASDGGRPYCALTFSDNDNCGACGRSCAFSGSGGTCCVGVCSDVASDSNNCGTCGHVCNGGTSCQAGKCSP